VSVAKLENGNRQKVTLTDFDWSRGPGHGDFAHRKAVESAGDQLKKSRKVTEGKTVNLSERRGAVLQGTPAIVRGEKTTHNLRTTRSRSASIRVNNAGKSGRRAD